MSGVRVLLTGFEPYIPGLDMNPSWEIVRPLDGAEVEGARVRAVRLPVAYGVAAARLAEAVEAFRPQAILCFGMHRRGPASLHAAPPPAARPEFTVPPGISPAVYVERRFRFAEREGESLEPEEPPERATLLPVERLLAAFARAGFAAAASDDAGLYVCEHTGFAAVGIARRCGLAAAGLIHVPPPDALPIERQMPIPLVALRALGVALGVGPGLTPQL